MNFYLPKFLKSFDQIKVLSFWFNPNADEWTMAIIANYANSVALKELYLDGCEWIDDLAILSLVSGKLKEPGGASGIEILSLSECRHIKCSSV